VVYPGDFFKRPGSPDLSQFDGIIAPDKGARLRAQGVADLAGLPVYTATKARDEFSGRLSNFAIEGLPDAGRLLVVDDICDGGGTFMGLAEASGLDRERLHLYVSHGVFSNDALYNLPLHFARIYTTNSYNPDIGLNYDHDFDYPVVVRHDVISELFEKVK
jgi:ribose-phosphate pyrophosphokinase